MEQLTYDQAREHMIRGISSAAIAHESDNLSSIDHGYEEIDAVLPRVSDERFDKLHIVLNFWDGWIDSRNHNWMNYTGIGKDDWPRLARILISDLEHDKEVSETSVLKHFDFRKKRQETPNQGL